MSEEKNVTLEQDVLVEKEVVNAPAEPVTEAESSEAAPTEVAPTEVAPAESAPAEAVPAEAEAAQPQPEARVETMEDYAKELEASFKRVKEGDVLTGTVAGVTEDQVLVDLKYYAGGVINKENINGDPDFQLQAEIHPGDEITACLLYTSSTMHL